MEQKIESDAELELFGKDFETTESIEIPKMLVDQVIGQDRAVEIIKKAASQRRHVMMIGTPGTGKSLLAKSMAELLPKEELEDVLIYPNMEDNNNPKIKSVPAGKGKDIVTAYKIEARKKTQSRNIIMLIIVVAIVIYSAVMGQLIWGIIAALLIFMISRQFVMREENLIPKLIVSNHEKEHAPFIDATGTHAGALFGDVRHDPFQSGGLETPSHERVESGDIHKANKGVLFIDEINILRLESQQNLLTALQEKKYPITGQSERSSGALVKTDPVPCDFVMIAAGNIDAVERMHPALRSRIKGSGYEVYMKDSMEDTIENKKSIIRFISQEVKNDGNIPHFDKGAVLEVIKESKRRSGRRGHLTLKLRDLGGLVRVAGDLAKGEGSKVTTAKHVIAAKNIARSIEQQLADNYLEYRKDYQIFKSTDEAIGRVNGLAVIGSDSGIVMPIIAEVTPACSKSSGVIIATGMLKDIAKESVQNVSAVIKNLTGKDIINHDIHVQFIGTHEGVEGDSASISIATAIISAMEKIPIDQKVAMTGSLSVRGDVLPVGGVTYKIEAAAKAKIKKVLIPKMNEKDVMIEEEYKDLITIIPVSNISEVIENSCIGSEKKNIMDRLKNLNLNLHIAIPTTTII